MLLYERPHSHSAAYTINMYLPSAFLFLIIKHVPPKSVYTSFGGGLMTRTVSTCFGCSVFFFFVALPASFQWGTVPCSALEFNLFHTKQTRHRFYIVRSMHIWLMTSSFWYCFRFAYIWSKLLTFISFSSCNKCFHFPISNKLVNRLVRDARVMTARQMNENKRTERNTERKDATVSAEKYLLSFAVKHLRGMFMAMFENGTEWSTMPSPRRSLSHLIFQFCSNVKCEMWCSKS